MVLEVDGKSLNKGEQHHLTHINLLGIKEFTPKNNIEEVCLGNQGLDFPRDVLVDLGKLNMSGSTMLACTLTHAA